MVFAVFFAVSFSGMHVAQAEPNGGKGGQCKSSGKAWGDLTKDQCSACGGKWGVDAMDCGGGIVIGSIAGVGGIYTANPWMIVGALGALGSAMVACEGSCQSTVQ
jgi:hypothetical protein